MNDTRRSVLAALEDGPMTGPALAERLDVSRSAIWKHVETLREAGFDIASDEGGYVLESIPEFGGPAVEYGLDAPLDVEYHESIPSTNDRARELAEAGETDVLVLADEQTGGRGRLDRSWESPSGGIWMSLLLRPNMPASHAPLLTLAAAVAVAKAVREAGVDAGVKWPNDVLVADDATDEERKLAGILTEMEGETDVVTWLIVGIGLNANVDPDDLPDGSTSLRAEVGDVSRRELTQRIFEYMARYEATPPRILEAWEDVALTLGRRVRIDTADGEVVGEAVDLEFPGALVVDTGEERVTVHAGDCEHLRPA